MSDSLIKTLLRLSEASPPAIIPGDVAKVYTGPEFDRLLKDRIVVERAPATEWSTCPSCDCGLDVRPVRSVNGRMVAACPSDSSEDVTLDEEDLRTFEIDLPAVVRRMASDSGFETEPDEVADGVWFLGLGKSKQAVFVAPSAAVSQRSGIFRTLRLVASGQPIVVVTAALPAVERAHLADSGIQHVALQDVCGSADGSSFALDPTGLTPVLQGDPRLVLNKPRQSALLDGDTLSLAPRSFTLLWLLGEAAASDGRIVSATEIEKHLGNNRYIDRGAAADAIRELRKDLSRGRRSNRARRKLIVTRHSSGYQLDLPAPKIELVT